MKNCFSISSIDLTKLSVNLEILVMTLLGGAEIITEGLQGVVETFKRRGRRTISGCSNASSLLRLSESTNTTSGSEENMLVF